MKIYVLADLEGTTGVVREEQTSADSPEYREACSLLTGDVNAAVEGAVQAGAGDIVVNDLHGARGGFNLVLEELHPHAKCITGGPRIYRLSLLDRSIDAALMVGYHAMAGTGGAVLEHTMSTKAIDEVRINDVRVGEIGIDASVLGCFDIPIVLVTGCRKTTDEARNLLGTIEVVAVKEGLTRHSALCLPPTKTRSLIKEASAKALQCLDDYKPLKFNPPYKVEIEYTHPTYADRYEKDPLAEMVDARTVRFRGQDLLRVMHNIGWY